MKKINRRKNESKIKQFHLKSTFLNIIENFEKENNYKFESYEIDNVLLEMIKCNHESYIIAKFGYDYE